MIIEALIVLIDLAFTALLTLTLPLGKGYHYWVPFLFLIIGYIVGIALTWLILTAFAMPFKKDKHYKKPNKWANFLLTESITYIDNHARAKIIYRSKMEIPKERYLLVCNHRSKFDPMLLTKLYGHKGLSFISKPTNFKIPLGGHFMKASCYQSIDRYDKLKSLEVMNEASRLVSEGLTSIGVFPEGTRSEDNNLHEFHEGVFSIAKKTNCPIVVVTLDGTENIHSNFPLHRTKVYMDMIEVLYPSDYQNMIVKEISDHVHDKMLESLGK